MNFKTYAFTLLGLSLAACASPVNTASKDLGSREERVSLPEGEQDSHESQQPVLAQPLEYIINPQHYPPYFVSRAYRTSEIDECQENRAPVADFRVMSTRGEHNGRYLQPSGQMFRALSTTLDDRTQVLNYTWLVDGETRGTREEFSYMLGEGEHRVSLSVIDDCGAVNVIDEGVYVGIYENENFIPEARASGAVAEAPDNRLSHTHLYNFDFSETGSGSFDPDGEIVLYTILFSDWEEDTPRRNRDGTTRTRYPEPGDYILTLTVEDNNGATSTDTTTYTSY